MLSRRAGLSALAGLSCYFYFFVTDLTVVNGSHEPDPNDELTLLLVVVISHIDTYELRQTERRFQYGGARWRPKPEVVMSPYTQLQTLFQRLYWSF